MDALIAAVVARAVVLGRTTPPKTADEREHARVEGWIHVPTCDLSALDDG
ncbi:hypothetical protein GCM10023205_17390 [Yinghuangia aomiensis]|uniref:Uncharacterized protein n=1 Tax=Yinghuangia aomiensis TaxID=676205 RepID=A0ABP9H0Z6_9ACTN